VEYKPKSRRNSVELCVQHAVQFTEETRADLAREQEIKQEVQRIQQKEEVRLANAKIEGLEPKPLLEIEKEVNDRYLRKTFGQISFTSRRSRCVSAANSQSSIRTQGEALDTCSSTSKAPYDSTQGTDCTHVPSQEEEEEDEDGLGPQFIFDTLASSGKSAVSRTDFLIDGLSHQQDGGEGEEDEEAFESPRSTTDGSLYVLGDAWVEEETRHFGQVISAPLSSTKPQPVSRSSTRPDSTAATPQGHLTPPSPASALALPNPNAPAAPGTPKANSVAGMLDRIKRQISVWDSRRHPKSASGAASTTASGSRTGSRASSVSGRQETVPLQHVAPAPGYSVATSARAAAVQLMQPHPPSVDSSATPSRLSTEDRVGPNRSCSSSRSLRPFSQASSRASSRACSREFGHEAPPTSSVPCTRRSLDSAGVPLPRFPAQTSRPSQDRSSLTLHQATPPRAVLRGSLGHHQPQHHSEHIPSLCTRRSLDTGDSMRSASGLLALRRDPRVRSRSSCMTPSEMTQGLSDSQPLRGPSTPHTEYAGTPARGTFYRPSIDQSSTSSSLASTPKASANAAALAAATACATSEPLASIGGQDEAGTQHQHQQPCRRRKSVSIMLHRKSKSTVTDVISNVLPS